MSSVMLRLISNFSEKIPIDKLFPKYIIYKQNVQAERADSMYAKNVYLVYKSFFA